MSKHAQSNWYTPVFAQWQPKLLGRKPTNAELETVHAFGKPGKQSLALAMALRDGGVTDPQIQLATGLVDGLSRPQNNHRREVLRAGYFNRLPVSKNGQGHTVYAIELTPKGKAHITAQGKVAKASTKPAPVKAKVTKPKAKKAVNIDKPSDEAVARGTAMIEASPALAELVNHKPEATPQS